MNLIFNQSYNIFPNQSVITFISEDDANVTFEAENGKRYALNSKVFIELMRDNVIQLVPNQLSC